MSITGVPTTTADFDAQPAPIDAAGQPIDLTATPTEVEAGQYPCGTVHVAATYVDPVNGDGIGRLLDLTAGGTLHVNGRALSVTGRTDGENPRDLADRLYDALPQRTLHRVEVHWSAGPADDDIPF